MWHSQYTATYIFTKRGCQCCAQLFCFTTLFVFSPASTCKQSHCPSDSTVNLNESLYVLTYKSEIMQLETLYSMLHLCRVGEKKMLTHTHTHTGGDTVCGRETCSPPSYDLTYFTTSKNGRQQRPARIKWPPCAVLYGMYLNSPLRLQPATSRIKTSRAEG